MDHAKLAALMAALDSDDVRVTPKGVILHWMTGEEWEPEAVMAAVREAQLALARVEALAAWAAQAPER